MTNETIQLQLLLDSRPASGSLMQALQRIRVIRGDRAPSTFELTFHTERVAGDHDFPLMGSALLASFARVTLVVTVSSEPKVLIDGYVSGRRLIPAGDPAGCRMTISGEDVSLKMGLVEISLDYPHSSDAEIVSEILERYGTFGIRPDVRPTPGSIVPNAFASVENGTDRQFLAHLAAKHGYRFYIVPGEPTLGYNTAYWGPPRLDDPPQKSLVADGGPGSNVEAIDFFDNALAPVVTYGAVSQDLLPPPTPQMVPLLAAASTRNPLSQHPGLGSYGDLAEQLLTDPLEALGKLLELDVRGSLLQPQSLGCLQGQEPFPLEAQAIAQARTDESTSEVVVARGRLTGDRYGQVLEAPGIVAVRGVGYSFDGLYYVQQVVHDVDVTAGGWSYTQGFTLTRGGLGSTVQEVSG